MIKREARLQTLFKRWVLAPKVIGNAAFELKRAASGRLPVSSLAPHQRDNLLRVQNSTFYYKIPDDSIGEKPFDCFVMQGAAAYVVVAFGKQLKRFFIIPIHTWDEITKKKKSITADDCAHPDVLQVEI